MVLKLVALAMEDRACFVVIAGRLYLLGQVHEATVASVAQILMIIFSCENGIFLHWAQLDVEVFSNNWLGCFKWRKIARLRCFVTPL